VTLCLRHILHHSTYYQANEFFKLALQVSFLQTTVLGMYMYMYLSIVLQWLPELYMQALLEF
jgi:hypothetical protein